MISRTLAFCVPAPGGNNAPGPDWSPAISWTKVPPSTVSYAIIMVDPDSPAVYDVTAPPRGRRVNFFHWVLIDIPPTIRRLPEGADSKGIVPGGKPPGPKPYGVRGINDYTKVFAGNPRMAGNYGGYDGPCPPWNDWVVHHYHFAVYALDVARLSVSGNFTGPQALHAMQGHVLAKGEAVGIYTLNADLWPSLGVTLLQ
jgi:Raf kinase inhibitor-like YbhB/YbcL family protein